MSANSDLAKTEAFFYNLLCEEKDKLGNNQQMRTKPEQKQVQSSHVNQSDMMWSSATKDQECS